MAKITIPSIFGSPTSRKHSKPLQQRSEDSAPVGPRPSSAPLSPRSKSVRTPPSARLRAQLQQFRPHSAVSRSDSNASSPRTEHDEGGKKEAHSTKGEKASPGSLLSDKAIDVKEGDVKNGRRIPGSPHEGKEEKVVSSAGNGKKMEANDKHAEANGKLMEAKARNTKDGRHTPGSPLHDSEETPELLVVLQEVRRKREATERKEWLDKWEGFADTLGSTIDLSLGAQNKDAGDHKREVRQAKSSNWLLERSKPIACLPSEDTGNGVSELQKAMARLPIEQQGPLLRKGRSTVSLPLEGEDSPLGRKRPMARVPIDGSKGWESFAEEELAINRGKRNYTPSERQEALSRLPIEEQRKLSGSLDQMEPNGDGMKADRKSAKATGPLPEGDAPATIHFSPRTLRTYVTLNPPTKPDIALSPAPKRSTRSPATTVQLYPAPRTSSRSFSDIHHSPSTKKSDQSPKTMKSGPALNVNNNLIPRLAVPEEFAGDAKAEDLVARWQTIREALWYDSDEEGDYAERIRLCMVR